VKVWLVGLWVALMFSPIECTAAGGEPVRLLERAGSAGEAIRLSDLLPPVVTPEMLRAAATVQLGRSPRLGSVRVLRAREIADRLANSAIFEEVSIPDQIMVQRVGYQLVSENVQAVIAEFLKKEHWPVSGVPALKWNPETYALSSSPRLEVDRTGWDAMRQELQFTVSCVPRKLCGSFLVQMPLSAEGMEQWRGKFGGSSLRHGQEKLTANRSLPLLVRAGQSCRFLVQSGGLRISLPVICLQRGRLGQTIRVREAGGHHTFTGQISSAATVQSSF